MAHFLASMFSTVQWFVANVVADEFLGATLDCAFFLLAEALDWNVDVTLLALALMALGSTLMLQTVQDFATGALTAELATRGYRTGHSPSFFSAETLHGYRDIARGARTRMT